MTKLNFALSRVDWPEGPLIEKKPEKDYDGWLKSIVAFANSTTGAEQAILFIGASNERPHKGISSAKAVDDIQRRISETALDKCYPPIKLEFAHLILSQEGGECHILAVIIPSSETKPHFAGQAFIRTGSRSLSASPEIFADLIASHNTTAGRLLVWKKQQIQWKLVATNQAYYIGNATVMDCTGTSAMIQNDETGYSCPIPISDISFLDRNGLCPVIQVKYWGTDRELMEYMLGRWETFISTTNPLYHQQVSYIREQAELHPEAFEPVAAYMVERKKCAEPLIMFAARLKERLRRR